MDLPIIDLSCSDDAGLATSIDEACRTTGFFVVIGHSVELSLISDMHNAARTFFSLDRNIKERIAMSNAGQMWRGWFDVGVETTAGAVDFKEGLYFGTESDPGVPPLPMHGRNQYPLVPESFAEAVPEYMVQLSRLSQRLVSLIDRALGVEGALLSLVDPPVELLRIFGYPANADGWGVGEHTDYGLLTVLSQDGSGGLEVRGGRDREQSPEWVEVPPIEGSFVCNIGDMLERATAGRYRSTAHRVRNTAAQQRISIPYFFDPGWNAHVKPLIADDVDASGTAERWDGVDPHLFTGTYGDYLWAKVQRVFPELVNQ